MTARAAVEEAARQLAVAGVPAPRREGRLLLLAVGGPDVLLEPAAELGPAASAFAMAVARRARREPFAYIVGYREFYGLRLAVGPDVLIPRPETEGLVEHAARLAPPGGRAADLCTGSGAVAIALAWTRPDLVIDASDLFPAALEVARVNLAACEIGARVRLHQGDLWEALPAAAYDVCTCNPPYVATEEWERLEPEVREWEPEVALVPAGGWRAMYRRLAAGASTRLAPGGWLLAEIGGGQGAAVAAIFAEAGLGDVQVRADLAGLPRYCLGRRMR